MKPSQWLCLLSLLICSPVSAYAAQEISSVETTIKTLMLDPNTQSPIVVLETVTDCRSGLMCPKQGPSPSNSTM